MIFVICYDCYSFKEAYNQVLEKKKMHALNFWYIDQYTLYCQKYQLVCLAFGDVSLGRSWSALETHPMKLSTHCF